MHQRRVKHLKKRLIPNSRYLIVIYKTLVSRKKTIEPACIHHKGVSIFGVDCVAQRVLFLVQLCELSVL
jgi:hypothetical protein